MPLVGERFALPWSFYIFDEGACTFSEHRSPCHPEPAFWAKDPCSSFCPTHRDKLLRSLLPPCGIRAGSSSAKQNGGLRMTACYLGALNFKSARRNHFSDQHPKQAPQKCGNSRARLRQAGRLRIRLTHYPHEGEWANPPSRLSPGRASSASAGRCAHSLPHPDRCGIYSKRATKRSPWQRTKSTVRRRLLSHARPCSTSR